jgi:hypothetical protein
LLKPVVLDQGDGLLLFKLFVDTYAQGFADGFAFLLDDVFIFDVCGPVVNVVCGNATGLFSSLNESSQVVVIGPFFKLEPFSIVDKLGQFVGKAFTEDLGGGGHFFL